jgi:hypothetical protein
MISMMKFIGDKTDVVEFVDVILRRLDNGLQSITIMPREKFEGFCVRIVTDTSLVDTVKAWATICWLEHTSTSSENTPDG